MSRQHKELKKVQLPYNVLKSFYGNYKNFNKISKYNVNEEAI